MPNTPLAGPGVLRSMPAKPLRRKPLRTRHPPIHATDSRWPPTSELRPAWALAASATPRSTISFTCAFSCSRCWANGFGLRSTYTSQSPSRSDAWANRSLSRSSSSHVAWRTVSPVVSRSRSTSSATHRSSEGNGSPASASSTFHRG